MARYSLKARTHGPLCSCIIDFALELNEYRVRLIELDVVSGKSREVGSYFDGDYQSAVDTAEHMMRQHTRNLTRHINEAFNMNAHVHTWLGYDNCRVLVRFAKYISDELTGTYTYQAECTTLNLTITGSDAVAVYVSLARALCAKLV